MFFFQLPYLPEFVVGQGVESNMFEQMLKVGSEMRCIVNNATHSSKPSACFPFTNTASQSLCAECEKRDRGRGGGIQVCPTAIWGVRPNQLLQKHTGSRAASWDLLKEDHSSNLADLGELSDRSFRSVGSVVGPCEGEITTSDMALKQRHKSYELATNDNTVLGMSNTKTNQK